MRNDLELEEYTGLSIAQRIPNVENRNLRSQVKNSSIFSIRSTFSSRF
jgi:hypothetical protein